MEKVYICKKSGINEAEICAVAELKTEGLSNSKERKENIRFLHKYGKSEKEITDHMNSHFEECNKCQSLYNSSLQGLKAKDVSKEYFAFKKMHK